jgi:hypothetical protein
MLKNGIFRKPAENMNNIGTHFPHFEKICILALKSFFQISAVNQEGEEFENFLFKKSIGRIVHRKNWFSCPADTVLATLAGG